MSLLPGTKLGPYEILATIGAGGMGEVYRAKDTNLARDVAIKLLPDTFANDPDRLARFDREAKLLASLNHPNIASIYGFERGALVMELVEGDSPKGPMSFDEAWQIASQIVAALEYAHGQGIIHRDLKPANIKITKDGVVKLLDFGLAKAFTEPVTAPAATLSNSPTLTIATEVGVILGTAAYMAPEQARGRSVDKRADIWAFGVVFHELLTGRQLFQGEDVSETLAQVLTKQPGWDNVPVKAWRLLEACLEKDPRPRLRDIGDAPRLLQQEEAWPTDRKVPKRPLARIAAVILAVLLLPALIVSWIHFRETPPVSPVFRSSILPPENTTLDFNFNNGSGLFQLSPDGQHIVLSARGADGNFQLWIRSLDESNVRPLPGTTGATFPFWSPDSRFLAFFANEKLMKMAISGGPPVELAEARAGRGGTWSKDDVIVFAPNNNSPLHKILSAGGPATPVTKYVPEEGPQRLPWFLPDGKHFLYRVQGSANALRIGSLDSLEPKILGPASSNAIYARGYLFFRRDTTLLAQPFDEKTLSTLGEAVPIADNVNVGLSAGFFSVSETGVLVYQASKNAQREGTPFVGSAGERTLAWIDRDGKQLEQLKNPGDIADLQLSPDRTKLAYSLWGSDPMARDLWIYDLKRQLPTKFTFDAGAERYPIWSPDGKSIVYTAHQKRFGDIYRKATDLSGPEELLWESSGDKAPTSWSPDGKFVLVNTYSSAGNGGVHIWKLPLTSERSGETLKPTPFLDRGSFQEIDGQFSSDGKWVAYTSNESGRFEVYVAPFPGPGGIRQISSNGGSFPRWRPDGKELYYMEVEGVGGLMAAEIINRGSTFDVGVVRQLTRGMINQRGYLYDLSKDGNRVLVHILGGVLASGERGTYSEPLTLVTNWPALLTK
jgi:serine/threonine protein kinase